MNDNERVVCRVSGDAWMLVWIFFGIALFLPVLSLFAPNRNATWTGVAFGVLFCVPALGFMCWAKKTYVVADAEGLMLSSMWRKAHLRWDEISDFYLTRRDKFQILHFVARGRTWELLPQLTNLEELMDAVAQKATVSRAKEWRLLGTRTFDEWPLTFRYKDSNGFLLVLFAAGVTLVLFALQMSKAATYGGFVAVWQNIADTMNALSVPMRIAFVMTTLFIFGAMPFSVVAIRWSQIKASHAFLQHTVSADLRGLIFQTPQEHTPVAWDRVLDFYLEPVAGALQSTKRCVVVTQRGEHTFLDTIQHNFLLREIIKTYATNAKSKEWAYKLGRNPEDLKTPARFIAIAGTKVFHFRTRANRALLLMFTILTPTVLISFFLRADNTSFANFVAGIIIATVIGGFSIWSWLSYFKTHIVLDERGISTHGWRGFRFFAWGGIESYTVGSDSFFTIESKGEKIRVFQMVTDISTFRNEVQKRAINSHSKHWRSATKSATKSAMKSAPQTSTKRSNSSTRTS